MRPAWLEARGRRVMVMSSRHRDELKGLRAFLLEPLE
jgi:hypothetical protein